MQTPATRPSCVHRLFVKGQRLSIRIYRAGGGTRLTFPEPQLGPVWDLTFEPAPDPDEVPSREERPFPTSVTATKRDAS